MNTIWLTRFSGTTLGTHLRFLITLIRRVMGNLPSLQVKKIISDKLGIPESGLSEQLSFQKDLGVDSLDFCELIWEVEKKFKMRISDEDMENIATIGQLISFVDHRMVA